MAIAAPVCLGSFEPVSSSHGYRHRRYAQSLSQFGAPLRLERSGGWILSRAITGSHEHDAIGCYPLFSCANWEVLHRDLEELPGNLVSLSVVTDPFGDYSESLLRTCFPDTVIPFKQHFVTDLRAPRDSFVAKHHRYYARRALRAVQVEQCERPGEFLDDWSRLYSELIERHRIRGISAFSRESFAKQFEVPGVIVLRAVDARGTAAMHLWYVQDEVAYYHLCVSSERGYRHNASYALMSHVLDSFPRLGVRWLALGAGAGLSDNDSQGLVRFKRGWSTGTRQTYFCGRVLNREKYAELVAALGAKETNYFPAYRKENLDDSRIEIA